MTAACEVRLEPRTNMFVMAMISSPAADGPVKVRNLSPHGALVEGPVLPELDERVELCRGSLRIGGTVSWRTEGRAGLRFDAAISVPAWLPQGRHGMAQQRVDAIVQQIKSDAPPVNPRGQATCSSQKEAAQYRALLEAVEGLGDDLAADPGIVERFGDKLQILDSVAQTLRKLAANKLR